MYNFTLEAYNEDTNTLEYTDYTINEGDTFFDKGLGIDVIVTIAETDNIVCCAYDNGETIADYEILYSNEELARYHG